MITIRSVLCPVDFSACAGRALGHAAMVARRFEAPLTVLYAAERMPTSQTPFAGYAAIPLPPVPVDELREEMRRFAEPIIAAAPAPRFLVREGHPITEIAAEAEGMTDGVVVMGTHGRTGIERVWLGSVTERVLRRVRCPVLTVPPGASVPVRAAHDAAAAPYKTIICAVDFSDASIRAVEHALTWAQEANARVIFLHVLEPQLDASTMLVAGHFSVPEYFGYVKKD
ncbi:MAG: universal stress protein, partial [Vicinamibacterales bacterium]